MQKGLVENPLALSYTTGATQLAHLSLTSSDEDNVLTRCLPENRFQELPALTV